MNSHDLTDQQIELMKAPIWQALNYLSRLQSRMKATGFPHNDRLYQDVCDAQAAMQCLHMSLHYLGCKSGVGRPPQPARREVEP